MASWWEMSHWNCKLCHVWCCALSLGQEGLGRENDIWRKKEQGPAKEIWAFWNILGGKKWNKWLKSAVMSYVRLKYISEERFTKCKILLPVSILVFRSCFTTGRAAACQTNVAWDKKGGNLHLFGTPFCACHLHVAVYIIANLFSWTSTFGLRQALWYLILPLQHSHLPAHLVSCLLSGWSSKMEIFPCFLSSSGP